jgi:EAL domain-containing protein (putative c-di-GMP-specific phosphodiesterase class I)
MQILTDAINAACETGDAESGTIQRALQAVRTHLGMEVAYLSEFVGNESIFRVVDAPGLEQLIKPGDARSLDDVYCQHILAGRLPQLIPDTSKEPICQSMPITAAVPIGAHVSIPIILPNGEPYGMFCCLSPQANASLNARDLNVVRLFADVAAHQIGRQVADRNEVADKKALIAGIIAGREFKLVFQPIINFRTGEVRGYEALCRFESLPYRSPDIWINDAKAAGLGVELELAIIDRAFEVWVDGPPNTYIAFNASPTALCDPRFLTLVDGRDLSSVVFEITEHTAVEDYAALNAQLNHLRAQGAKIAIDDAGAGFSSLRHIVQLAPDFIKLDMALTRDIDSDPSRRALASAFVYFAHETGAEIVAEGIETDAELQTLYALGINVGQGYYLCRPLERDAVTPASLGYGSAVSAARF